MNKLFTLSILLIFANACLANSGKKPLQTGSYAEHLIQRRLAEKRQGNLVITDEHIKRRLQVQSSPAKWRRMKIWFDLTELKKQNPKYPKFYQKAFDLTAIWWQNAVWIKDSKEKQNETVKNLFANNDINDYNIPADKGTWRDYDLLVSAKMVPTDGTTLAWAGPLYRHPDNQRPITGDAGVCWFGHNNFVHASDSMNRAVGTLVHEFAHVMAFISLDEYHKHFVNYDKDLKAFLWTGLQVRQRASEFYGCKFEETKGIALESIDGKPGAHWSESTMHDELMTPYSGAEPEKVSPMMLALMEDSFWYKSDYSYVENYSYEKGDKRGCTQKSLCPKIPKCELGTKDFLTSDWKGMGYCDKDENGCPREIKYSNMDITKPKVWEGAVQDYGGDFGSKSIFVQGEILKWNKEKTSYDSVQNLPVRAICRADLKAYTLYFHVFQQDHRKDKEHAEDEHVVCKEEGMQKFNCNGTYCSEVKCFNPKSLCEERYSQLNLQQGKPHCHISCMSNGRCQPGLHKNTPNANLIAKDIFKKLGIKNPNDNSSRRLLRKLDMISDNEKSFENDEDWGIDEPKKQGPTEKPQAKITPVKSTKAKKALLGAAKKTKPVESEKKALQTDKTFESDAKQYSCWCYWTGKRSWKCPRIGEIFKQKQFKL